MKYVLSIVLGVACLGLVIALVSAKRSEQAQQENDAGIITDFSNQLSSAQTELDVRQGKLLTLSNSLDESLSNTLAVSNRLTGALSAMASEKEQQSTNLNQRVAQVESENQGLVQQIATLTNQIAGLSQQIISNEVSLNMASNDFQKSYSLLENRLRRDVAERVLVEREFDNPSELQVQLERLKENPPRRVTPQNIYSGLDIEVESNGTFHVLSPD